MLHDSICFSIIASESGKSRFPIASTEFTIVAPTGPIGHAFLALNIKLSSVSSVKVSISEASFQWM